MFATEVKIVEGVELTDEFLGHVMRRGDVLYPLHPNGGGWVAETAAVDPDTVIGPFATVSGESAVGPTVIISGRSFIESSDIGCETENEVRIHSSLVRGYSLDTDAIKMTFGGTYEENQRGW